MRWGIESKYHEIKESLCRTRHLCMPTYVKYMQFPQKNIIIYEKIIWLI